MVSVDAENRRMRIEMKMLYENDSLSRPYNRMTKFRTFNKNRKNFVRLIFYIFQNISLEIFKKKTGEGNIR